MRRKLIAFIGTILVGGVILVSMKGARNDFFEYCTTKAYGLPLPWKIENCECDGQGGQTVYPKEHLYFNASIVVVMGLFVALITPNRNQASRMHPSPKVHASI